jgi:hypothetical protein
MSNTQPQYQKRTSYHQQQEDHHQDTQHRYAPNTSPYHSRLSQNTQQSFNTNCPSSYYSQETQTSPNQNMQQPYGYQTPQQSFQSFLDASFTPMLPLNRPGPPLITQTQPNYSDIGHELSYDGNASLHKYDYTDLSEYLRESPVGGGDVHESSNPQTPGVNHQRGLGSHV